MRFRRAALILCAVALLLSGCDIDTTPATIATPRPGAFTFGAEDGVLLAGQIFGQGNTALVFSNGLDAIKESWEPIPQELAARGYLALLYDYRGVGQSKGINDSAARDRDLRGAVNWVRAHGATSVVLIGASFGGSLSAKLAAELNATALVILSSPLSSGGLSISDDELRALAMPKLLMVSQGDVDIVGDVQHMFDVAPPPKALQVYPGAGHGTAILHASATSADATQRLESFLQQYAPPSGAA